MGGARRGPVRPGRGAIAVDDPDRAVLAGQPTGKGLLNTASRAPEGPTPCSNRTSVSFRAAASMPALSSRR